MGRWPGWVVLALVALPTAGCGDDPDCPPRPTTVVRDRPVEVAHRGPDVDHRAAARGASLVLHVANSQATTERVRVALAGDTALDVDLPALPEQCWTGHAVVFGVGYDVPPGPVEVAVTIQGATSTSTIEVPARGPVWGVVDVQGERAWGDLQVYAEEPVWG
jgi:hypothetical protein